MHLRNLFVMTVVAVSLAASSASAATVTYILDLSVPGTFTLKADASAGDNGGIVALGVGLTGNVLTLDNRLPYVINTANFQGAGFGAFRAPAFPDGAAAVNPFISGSQDAIGGPPANRIYGFGQEASSWVAKSITPAASPDATADSAWLDPLMMAIGTYDGTLDFDQANANNAANVWAQVGSGDAPAATLAFQVIPLAGGNTAPDVTDAIVGPPYNNNLPGDPQTLVHQFVATDTETPAGPFAWDQLTLVSYTPNYSGVGPGPLLTPTLSATGEFSWVSEGSPRGDYIWSVRTTDPGGLSSTGTLTVHANLVPEPSTIALCGLAMVGAMGFVRRRNG